MMPVNPRGAIEALAILLGKTSDLIREWRVAGSTHTIIFPVLLADYEKFYAQLDRWAKNITYDAETGLMTVEVDGKAIERPHERKIIKRLREKVRTLEAQLASCKESLKEK